jgi:hypothetical protein
MEKRSGLFEQIIKWLCKKKAGWRKASQHLEVNSFIQWVKKPLELKRIDGLKVYKGIQRKRIERNVVVIGKFEKPISRILVNDLGWQLHQCVLNESRINLKQLSLVQCTYSNEQYSLFHRLNHLITEL